MAGILQQAPWFTGLDNSGDPVVGGLVFTYTAGTSTKEATYTDAALSVPNTNPIVLDAGGRCVMFLDPSKDYKIVMAPATDTDPPTSPIVSQDDVDGSYFTGILKGTTDLGATWRTKSQSLIVDVGLDVGFVGTPVADDIRLGDANFLLDFDAGTSPNLNFDSGDAFSYTRGANQFNFTIAATEEVAIGTSGMEIADGLVVGFAGTPVADEVEVGDANFGLDFDSGTAPHLRFDSGSDTFAYTRGDNEFLFNIGGTEAVAVHSGGMEIAGGLTVGFAEGPDADRIKLGDSNCGMQFNSGNPIVDFDTGDYLGYTRGSDQLGVYVGGVEEARFGASGLNVLNGLTVGYIGTPTDGTILIGTADRGIGGSASALTIWGDVTETDTLSFTDATDLWAFSNGTAAQDVYVQTGVGVSPSAAGTGTMALGVTTKAWGSICFGERSTQSVPAANEVYLYAVANGAKTDLVAVFQTGTEVVVASEV